MERNPRTRALPRIAAIDIGSNSIRLVVAEMNGDGTYRVLDEERDMARLGEGLARTGRLGRGPMQAALRALEKMKAIADGFRARVRAIATSAVRDASNGRVFQSAVKRRLGIRLEIISGQDEALLAFRSAARHFDLEGKKVAVADIGGGSLEVLLASGTVPEKVHSLPLGTVRLTEELCRSDPLRPRHWKSLRKEIDRALKQEIGKAPFHTDVMIASGGTFTALAQIAKAERGEQPGPVQGFVLTQDDLTRLLAKLRKMPLAARRRVSGLNPNRADIIIAGVTVVTRLAKRLGVRRILVNERGIRDGILLSMIAERGSRTPAQDVTKPRSRLEWARILARKCRSSERHCGHVARLAGKIFDGLQSEHALPLTAREALQTAALLHEVGGMINHAQQHKHTYHLIRHSDLPGFSAREVELIANVARYGQGAFPKKSHPNFAQLNRQDRKLVRMLSGILRVADSLDRTSTQRVTGIECRSGDRKITLVIESRIDPQVEVWDAKRKAGLFEKAFDAELAFQCKSKAAKREPRLAAVGTRIEGRPLQARRAAWLAMSARPLRAARARR